VDLNPSPDTDDLLVSEWPDPVEATSIASIDSDTDDDTDKDAFAGGG
jgi:hypothetical protein